jgi:FKBP-type peptidyl-prolyl cis-trans isomerase FkpA
MNRILLAFVLLLPVASRAQPLKNDEEKTLYALGLIMGGNLKAMSLKPAEVELVKRGMSDAAQGKKEQVSLEEYGPKVQQFAQGRSSAAADKEKAASKEFQAKMAKEQGATQLPSGLILKTLKPGTGKSPAATDKVKVNYEGKLTNGTVFDSSYKRGQPAEFGLNQVIPCWTEGVQKMKVGEKAQLVCPSSIAYGDHGHPPSIPGGATLVFEVELLGITTPAAPAPAATPAPAPAKK